MGRFWITLLSRVHFSSVCKGHDGCDMIRCGYRVGSRCPELNNPHFD